MQQKWWGVSGLRAAAHTCPSVGQPRVRTLRKGADGGTLDPTFRDRQCPFKVRENLARAALPPLVSLSSSS